MSVPVLFIMSIGMSTATSVTLVIVIVPAAVP